MQCCHKKDVGYHDTPAVIINYAISHQNAQQFLLKRLNRIFDQNKEARDNWLPCQRKQLIHNPSKRGRNERKDKKKKNRKRRTTRTHPTDVHTPQACAWLYMK